MPEDNDRPQPGTDANAGGERGTDRFRADEPAGSASPDARAAGDVPEGSTEQTTQISRVDPSDEELREAMWAAAATERVSYEPPEADSERTQRISAVPPATQQLSGSLSQPPPEDERTEKFGAASAAAGATAVWSQRGGGGGDRKSVV